MGLKQEAWAFMCKDRSVFMFQNEQMRRVVNVRMMGGFKRGRMEWGWEGDIWVCPRKAKV